jgi:hypothetical protein
LQAFFETSLQARRKKFTFDHAATSEAESVDEIAQVLLPSIETQR